MKSWVVEKLSENERKMLKVQYKTTPRENAISSQGQKFLMANEIPCIKFNYSLDKKY